jgi:cold shock CspA family protein
LATIRLKGQLVTWDDSRGFGFITQKNSTQNIFVHIYAFGKAISRRPKVGDTIYYNVHTNKNGKIKAVDAIVEGVALRKKTYTSRQTKHLSKRGTNNSGLIIVLCAVFLLGIGSSLFNQLQSGVDRLIPVVTHFSNGFKTSLDIQQPAAGYGCDGKTHCSQMTSCEEAEFYLRNCPGTAMDGDGDGIPCESQWCR